MPPLEEVDCWQTAVLRPASGGSDTQGVPILGNYIELAPPNGVRWLNKQAYVVDPFGQLILVDATAVVCQEIPVHSEMWLGTLADWLGTGSADTLDQSLMVVKSYDEVPDLGLRFYRRTVGLMRLHNR